VVGQAKVVTSFEDALATMASPQFDPSMQAVVEAPDGGLPPDWQSRLSPGTTSVVSIARPSANTLEIDATLSNPGLLVVSETYYPGWKATVDGKVEPILIVDGMIRGLYLDAGHHVIRFSYEPLSFEAGVGLAVLSAGVLLACLIAMGRRVSVPTRESWGHV
jgi:Bacterial membrane protein YfhO